MIDIIIPAYNCHDTIEATLHSIKMQTIKNLIKVYIIDDASSKNYNYLKEKFKSNLDITILKNEKNLGPGLSRQKGLDNSNSEFIIFIDADDLFYDAYAVETLYNNIQDQEFVMGRILEEQEKYKFRCLRTQKYCLHGKIYRRSIIKKYNLKFFDVRNHEDNAFNYLYMNCCDKLKRIDKIIYIYQFNSNSITKNNTDIVLDIKNFIIAYTWLIDESFKRDIDITYIAQFIYYCILYAYAGYIQYNNVIDLSFVFDELSEIKKLYLQYNFLSKEEKNRLWTKCIEIKEINDSITLYDFIKKIK